MLPHGIGLCYGCENDFLAIMITSFDSSDRDKLLPGPPGSRLPESLHRSFNARCSRRSKTSMDSLSATTSRQTLRARCELAQGIRFGCELMPECMLRVIEQASELA